MEDKFKEVHIGHFKKGFKLKDVFQIVKHFKKKNLNKPLILMGYYNLIYQNGENNFLKNCKNLV